jgi:undecaprenyl diphosphate synthase
VLTFWCFSTENWKRSPAEIQVLMRLLDAYLDCEREELKKHRIRVLHSGRRDRLPVSLVKKLMDLEHDVDDPAMILHLAIDYGGKDEVVRAVRRMVAEGELDGDEMTEEAVRAHVDQPGLPDIDLVIRTSGEQRTSNFFLWQAAYAEWVFLQKYFPDFRPEDLAATVEEYRARSRRFGA